MAECLMTGRSGHVVASHIRLSRGRLGSISDTTFRGYLLDPVCFLRALRFTPTLELTRGYIRAICSDELCKF